MQNFKLDFHMHSTASDGTLSPAALAEECFSLGITHAALTDHDTILGQREFLERAAELGLCVTSGVELNAEHPHELHILGYGFDIDNKELKDALDSLAQHRLTRASRIVEALTKHGYPIEEERVREIAGDGVIGRPHIAQALVEKGSVADIPQAFRELIGEGCPGRVPRFRISTADAIRIIRNAGGRAVLAHPGCMRGEDYEALIWRLKKQGLEGIEAFYPAHTDEQCRFFADLAEKNGLFVTVGSDFHGGVGHAEHPSAEQRGYEKVSSGALFNLF